MATPNYVLLQRVTVSGTAVSSVVLSNLPSTGYTDLKVVWSARNTNAIVNGDGYIQFNGSSANYTNSKMLYGSGSAAASASQTQNYMQWAFETPGANATANSFSNGEMYIANYTSSNNKTVSIDQVVENKATEAYQFMNVSGWNTSAAITSITFVAATSTIAPNSTFAVYGLAAVGTTPTLISYATGGDIIKTDGTYWYHTFLSSGAFVPSKTMACDYLVVAGGGSGSGGYGSGGGAGGYRSSIGSTTTNVSASTLYPVTIGAGGAAQPSIAYGNLGTNSTFGTISATGGGGAGYYGVAGLSGGSGGGGGITTSGGSGNAGGYTPVEGYAGGAGWSSGTAGGGGGGAGAVGQSAPTSTQSGAGGAGIANSISGTSVTYAGGGGSGGDAQIGISAGAGGTGGGGAGSSSTNGTAGTANTGGGGGGGGRISGSTYTGAAGGSGIVIIRYAV